MRATRGVPEIEGPSGCNHFKSQSGGGGDRRRRQALEVRRIADRLTSAGNHVVVLGDLNEGPEIEGSQAVNLSALLDNNTPLVMSTRYPPSIRDPGRAPSTHAGCATGSTTSSSRTASSAPSTAARFSARACWAPEPPARQRGRPTQRSKTEISRHPTTPLCSSTSISDRDSPRWSASVARSHTRPPPPLSARVVTAGGERAARAARLGPS